MSLAIRVLMTVGLVACLTSVAHALKGTATLDTPPYVPSACFGQEDKGHMIVAVNNKLFADKRACGRVFRVRCTGPSDAGCKTNMVEVTVVDLCRDCHSNQIVLSEEAFAKIADPEAGRINVEYTQIAFTTEFEDAGNKLVIESISSLFT